METKKEKLKKIYEGLSAPFPQEAYSKDGSRGFDLTSLKAQYIVERLNEVLGIGGWSHSGEYVSGKGTLFMGELRIYLDFELVTIVEQVGFKADGKNVGDSYKSAKTDSLSKCASHVGVGNEMYKGLVSPSGAGQPRSVNTGDSGASKHNLKDNGKPPIIDGVIMFGKYRDRKADSISSQELKGYFDYFRKDGKELDGQMKRLYEALVALKGS